jgi:hypothetical protein
MLVDPRSSSFVCALLLVACAPAPRGGDETSGGEDAVTRTIGSLSCTVSGASIDEADLILAAVDTHATEVVGCGTDELVLATDAGHGPLRVDGASTNLDCVTAALAGYQLATVQPTTTRCRRIER